MNQLERVQRSFDCAGVPDPEFQLPATAERIV